MKFASRSAMLSLSSAKAGSKDARGSEEVPESGPEGVVCEARNEVREGGRRGVVGRDGTEGLRVCEGVAILELAMCERSVWLFGVVAVCMGWYTCICVSVFTLNSVVDDRLHSFTPHAVR